MNIPYIDLHTHHPVNSEHIRSVTNVFLQDVDAGLPACTYFSAAVHPWHASAFTVARTEQLLEKLAELPGLIAIGETGLDKACSTPFQQQQLIFGTHVRFAEQLHKPLLIHAVRSWNELIEALKKAKIPAIIHGYTGGSEITKQLMALGTCFSFGKGVLSPSRGFMESLRLIPPGSIFMETDDGDVEISEIYAKVSQLYGLSMVDLKIQLIKNFEQLFGKAATKN